MFEWKPFIVFISYLIEIVALLIVYTVVKVKDDELNRNNRYSPPIFRVLMGMVPVILINLFLIYLMTQQIDPHQEAPFKVVFFMKEVYFVFASALIIYFIEAFQISNSAERFELFQDNFIVQVLFFSLANIAGFGILFVAETESFLVALAAMVAMRIVLEIYFSRKMKLI